MWTLNERTIQAKVPESSPIERILVRRVLPDTVTIEVFEAPLAMIWESNGQQVTIAESGAVVANVSQYNREDPEVQAALAPLVIVRDERNFPVRTGEQVVGRSFVRFMRDFQQARTTYLAGLSLREVTVRDTTYDLKVVFSDGTTVLLSTIDTAAVQIRNLVRLQRDGKLIPGGTADLRVDRWAFVR
jgi:cell division septal protein FtsQ